MTQKNLDYDGHLVVVVDQEHLSKSPEVLCMLEGHPPIRRTIDDANKSILHSLSWKTRADDKEVKNDIRALWRREEMDKRYKDLVSGYGKEIADIILGGRLKMSLLIDTNGGKATISDTVAHAAQTVLSNGGEVESYVPRMAHSAGALIFGSANKRYVTADSGLMWHLSSITQPADDDDDEIFINYRRSERESQMEALFAFFEENTNSVTRSTVMAQLEEADADIHNPQNDVNFTGRDLYECGVATEAFQSIAELAEKYYEGCVSETDTFIGRSFFNTVEIVEKLEGETGEYFDVAVLRQQYIKEVAIHSIQNMGFWKRLKYKFKLWLR